MPKYRIPIIILIVWVFALPCSAYAEDYVGFGCAPWDGPTFQINTSMRDITISASIWLQGYADLKNGTRAIAIDNKGAGGTDSSGTGSALVKHVNQQKPTHVDATVFFDELDLKVGGKAAGYIRLPDGTKVLFQGTIPAAPTCGGAGYTIVPAPEGKHH